MKPTPVGGAICLADYICARAADQETLSPPRNGSRQTFFVRAGCSYEDTGKNIEAEVRMEHVERKD